MADNAIEIKSEVSNRSSLPLTRADVDRMKEQRALLKEYVQSQLVEGIKRDFAVIPGTKDRSLLQPGAEKLCRLFNLGSRVSMSDKIFDIKENYAEFTYKCEIYNLATGVVIAECEGSASSQEVKYRERKVWRDQGNGRKEQTAEVTPISDVSNTLKKMAQKRAFIGAVIKATAASDFFTQDIETVQDAEAVGMKARQEPSGNVAPGPGGEYVIPFGKYKGQALSQIAPDDLKSFGDWLSKQPELSRGGQDALAAINKFFS